MIVEPLQYKVGSPTVSIEPGSPEVGQLTYHANGRMIIFKMERSELEFLQNEIAKKLADAPPLPRRLKAARATA